MTKDNAVMRCNKPSASTKQISSLTWGVRLENTSAKCFTVQLLLIKCFRVIKVYFCDSFKRNSLNVVNLTKIWISSKAANWSYSCNTTASSHYSGLILWLRLMTLIRFWKCFEKRIAENNLPLERDGRKLKIVQLTIERHMPLAVKKSSFFFSRWSVGAAKEKQRKTRRDVE